MSTFLALTTGLTSFPDYLVLHTWRAGSVPKKLDVYIDVADIIAKVTSLGKSCYLMGSWVYVGSFLFK
ncbi:hypothetical protein GLYMA_06G271300v4 [Glycine max]|nr:hypothetical protein GLYMA_06G271300v4 [Glycine max]KAH1127839.1 hypothetical protein GYH30_016413 [Glycine max]